MTDVYVKVFKMTDTAQMPHREHETDACFDLFADEDIDLEGGKTVNVGTGIKLEIPPGFEGVIRPRSGLSANTGLRIANSPGTIDAGYRGEIIIILSNTDKDIKREIRKGMRIAQIGFREIPNVKLEEVLEQSALSSSKRGKKGLGSSGI